MDSNTLEALNKSIKKWERRAEGKSDACGFCPLCVLYNPFKIECDYRTCKGCPVEEATGEDFCESTPYIEWNKLSEEWDEEGDDVLIPDDVMGEMMELAKQEVEFLKSLLPKADH